MIFNKKQRTYMTTVLLSALLLAACHSPEPTTVTPDPIIEQPKLTFTEGILGIYNDFPLDRSDLLGDTTVIKKVVKLHTPPTKDPDLTNLKNNDDPDLKGKPHRYVAIGGSLTAGMRDWGLYQESQQTSFPNMLAIQMKLKNFRQPLFADAEYNGYGYKLPTTNIFGSPFPMYNAVINNLSIKSKDKHVTLNSFISDVDNFGIPLLANYDASLGGTLRGFSLRDDNPAIVKRPAEVYQERIATSLSSGFDPAYQDPKKARNSVMQQKFDFFTLEIGLYDFLESQGSPSFLNNMGIISPAYNFLKYAQSIKAKGCIANVPDIMDFPYYNFITTAQLKKALGVTEVYVSPTGRAYDANPAQDNFKYLPTPAMDSIFSTKNKLIKRGSTYKYPISGTNYIGGLQIIQDNLKGVNALYSEWGKQFSYPVVDLYSMYKKIASGTYLTDAGTKVDPTFGKGNFYSSDGIYPTAFGQAIIANEFIRTFNAYYKTSIPLIQAEEYLPAK
jgi:hypothetical protein